MIQPAIGYPKFVITLEVYMKTTTRWILGIGLGLIVMACLAAAGFFVFGRMGGFDRFSFERPALPRENGRVLPWRDMPRDIPMNPFDRMPRLGFGAMVRPMWGIAILFLCGLTLAGGLVAAVVVALARGSRSRAAIETVPVSAPPEVPKDDQPAQETCPNCGREVNPDWQHCPYCATNLTSSPPDA
jgi:hypothetical protein